MKKMELRTFKEQKEQSLSTAAEISPITTRISSTAAPTIWKKTDRNSCMLAVVFYCSVETRDWQYREPETLTKREEKDTLRERDRAGGKRYREKIEKNQKSWGFSLGIERKSQDPSLSWRFLQSLCLFSSLFLVWDFGFVIFLCY